MRNYIYGKTLKDTVRVAPSDEGFNYHRGYNGTAGKIPEEGTPDYEIFARNPYGHVAFGEEEEDEELPNAYFAAKKSAPENTGSLNVLAKTTSYGCVTREPSMPTDIPRAQCIRYERKDIPYNAPNNGLYGHSDVQLSVSFKCECNASGKYQPSFSGKTTKEKIEVYMSVWRYNFLDDNLREYCRDKVNLQRTYAHEVQHIINARYKANNIGKLALTITYDTKEKCEKQAKEEKDIHLVDIWNEWYRSEQRHENKIPKSPEVGRDSYDSPCN
jgi:hypothetical protein